MKIGKSIVFSAIVMIFSSCTMSMEEKVEQTLRRMTVEQKVAQLVILPVSSFHPPARHSFLDSMVHVGVGGVIVMEDRLDYGMERLNELQRLAKIPLLVAVDGEYGPAMRFAEFPFFPKMQQIGALPNDELVYQMGRHVGELCAMAKIFVNFAPVVDVNVNPANPAINTRSFGSDKERVAQYGSAYMRGMQDAGIYACAKHFPGHGDTEIDSHQALPILPFDKKRLDSLEIYPFRRLIADSVAMMMVGHLLVPALDSVHPASLSYPIVTRLLKGDLGFHGIVIADALNMRGLDSTDAVKTNLAAYKAGVDILLMPNEPEKTIRTIARYVGDDPSKKEILDEKVRKILTLKAEKGMLERDYDRFVDSKTIVARVQRQTDTLLIRQIAEKTMTIVQNKKGRSGAFIGKTQRVAYVGYHAEYQENTFDFEAKNGLSGFNEASGVLKNNEVLVYQELKSEGYNVTYFSVPKQENIYELQMLVNQLFQYDYVLLGIHDALHTRHSLLSISPDECRVLRRMMQWIPTAVLYFGNPYGLRTLPFVNDADMFVVGYADNIPNERAIARIVKGEIPAVGHLPIEIK